MADMYTDYGQGAMHIAWLPVMFVLLVILSAVLALALFVEWLAE